MQRISLNWGNIWLRNGNLELYCLQASKILVFSVQANTLTDEKYRKDSDERNISTFYTFLLCERYFRNRPSPQYPNSRAISRKYLPNKY